jgi:hypothetical protein
MTLSIFAIDRNRGELGFEIPSCFWKAEQLGLAKMGVDAIVSSGLGNLDFAPGDDVRARIVSGS